MSWFKKSIAVADAPAPEAPVTESPAVEPLTEAEVDWVRSTIAALAEQHVQVDDIDDIGRHYDELLTVWLRIRAEERPDPNALIDGIGLAFGQFLADRAGLEWAVAFGASGPELALHRTQGEVQLYPTRMVTEQWAARETQVLPALAYATLQSLQGSRGQD